MFYFAHPPTFPRPTSRARRAPLVLQSLSHDRSMTPSSARPTDRASDRPRVRPTASSASSPSAAVPFIIVHIRIGATGKSV